MAVSWPADHVERRPIAALVPYANNSRSHSSAQIGQIAASIKQWGWTVPVLVDEAGGLIAGHARIAAARLLGIADAPVMVARGWSEDQKRAYVLADNQLAMNAAWDNDLLAQELKALATNAFDMDLIGFAPDELARLLGGPDAGLTDPDDAPAAPVTVVSALGDAWLLGKHRLVCGDCTDATAVSLALGGAKPNLMVTDPPYGVEYDADWRNKRVRQEGSPIGGRAVGKVENDSRADWRAAWALFPGNVAYVWCASLHSHEVADSLLASGFILRSQIVWSKSNFAISRGDYHWQHEPCWYVVRKGAQGNWCGDRKQTTIWDIAKPAKSETGHSTQKPIECMKRPIANNSASGDAIYEPFSGSGSTIIAAEMTGRTCLALELNPAYIDVAVLRWRAFTGIEATLEGDGRSFSDIAKERVPVANGALITAPVKIEAARKAMGRPKVVAI